MLDNKNNNSSLNLPTLLPYIYAALAGICMVYGQTAIGLLAIVTLPFVTKTAGRDESLSLDGLEKECLRDSQVSVQSVTQQVPVGNKKQVYSLDELYAFRNYPVRNIEYKVVTSKRNTSPMNKVVENNSNEMQVNWRSIKKSSSTSRLHDEYVERSSSRSSSPLNRCHSEEPDHDLYHQDPSSLPTEVLTGKIQWIHCNNGRIRSSVRIAGVRDIFFHFKDVAATENPLEIGNQVTFRISVFHKRLCATDITVIDN
ncbi:hypothetical protein WA158_003076 [Blastocystis sp. Blastoise]